MGKLYFRHLQKLVECHISRKTSSGITFPLGFADTLVTSNNRHRFTKGIWNVGLYKLTQHNIENHPRKYHVKMSRDIFLNGIAQLDCREIK